MLYWLMFILLIQVFEDKHGILLSFPKTVKITLMKILNLHYKTSSTLLIGCGTDFTMTCLRKSPPPAKTQTPKP